MDMTQFLLRLQDHAERIARASNDTCRQTRAHLSKSEELHRQTSAMWAELRTALDCTVTSINRISALPAPTPTAPTKCRRVLPLVMGGLGLSLGLALGHFTR